MRTPFTKFMLKYFFILNIKSNFVENKLKKTIINGNAKYDFI